MPSGGIAESYGSSVFSFLGTSILFSIVASLIYIPTNSSQAFPFFHIFANTCYILGFFLVIAILTGVR